MPISPEGLLEYIIKSKYDLTSICAEIDSKLISCDLSNDGIYTVQISLIPDAVAEMIKERYLKADWFSVGFGIVNSGCGDGIMYTQITFSVN
jgi:hypothetical protein